MPKWVLAASLAVVAGLSVTRVDGNRTLAVLEAEAYAELMQPMRVMHGDALASGDAWVDLPLGSGKGWRGKGGGRLTYRVEVSAAGRYAVWARTWWIDGCSNALFLQVNGSPTVILGNDAVFGQWHWVCSPWMGFDKGLNHVRFSNHSDGVRIDKLAITNDPLYYPQGLADEITHFFDGFGGCDADNTGSWSFPRGRWRVVRNPAGVTGAPGDCLAQFDSSGGTALAGNRFWHDYNVRVKVMLTGPGIVSVILYAASEEDFFGLAWELSEAESAISLEQVTQGRKTVLCRKRMDSMRADTWYDVAVSAGAGFVCAAVDGTECCRAGSSGYRKGQVGLATTASGVFFDNVEVAFEHAK